MNFIRNSLQKNCLRTCPETNLKSILVKRYSVKKNQKLLATKKALAHFDDFYGGIYKYAWHSVRLGLLSQPKHVVLLNNFGEIEETKELLKNSGALDLRLLLRSTESDEDAIAQSSREEFIEFESDQDKTENVIEEVEEEEDVLRAIYPEGSNKKFDRLFENYRVKEEKEEKEDDDGICDKPASLHEALSHSQIDSSRLIDPAQGLDSSSLHEYIPVTELKGNDEYIPEGDYYRFYKVDPETDVNTETQSELPFPEHLNVYSYPRGDISRFPPPKCCVNRIYNYYPMDGASLLPVLALGLESGDRVLDMCAGPGGKSLAIIQTMLPQIVVCNESSLSRCNRIRNIFRQYLDDYPQDWETVIIKTIPGERFVNDICINKILVDVPCTTDRLSVLRDENNIFKSSRTKERLTLPQYQANILENALSIVEPGGTVVYSTCTLSPIQNEGVVNLALQNVWKNHGVEFTVIDLTPAVSKMKHFYRFATNVGLKYGSLVLPFVPVNFGPMYFCKLIKNR